MYYKYFVIAELLDFSGHYAIKSIDSNDKLHVSDLKFKFNLDNSKLLYIGCESGLNNYYSKLDFSLKNFQTKLNKDVYKVSFNKAFGRISYGCENMYVHESITSESIHQSQSEERSRRMRLGEAKVLVGKEKRNVELGYEYVENKWLDFWKQSKQALHAFHSNNSKPAERNYMRSGMSGILFGRFNEEQFKIDSYHHFKKLQKLCSKLADKATSLKLSFIKKCPEGCGCEIEYFINFEGEKEGIYVYIDDEFPFGIYKKLHDLSGGCPECGSFTVSYVDDPDEYTCLFHNYHNEIIQVIDRILLREINHAVEKEIYR